VSKLRDNERPKDNHSLATRNRPKGRFALRLPIVPSVTMIRIGTSGYNYPEWRGSFYPEKFPTGKMLPYYAERFSTVEINYTFYRMPNAKTIADWDAETPAEFSFARLRRIANTSTPQRRSVHRGQSPHRSRARGSCGGAELANQTGDELARRAIR
jgi:hypothetical protein